MKIHLIIVKKILVYMKVLMKDLLLDEQKNSQKNYVI